MCKFLIKAVAFAAVVTSVTACDHAAPNPEATVQSAAPSFTAEEVALQKWSRSCALCHVNGEGGAPISGNVEAWQPRLSKGKAVLVKHTIEGFNNMPPLGYCMSCERTDLEILIDFMSGGKS